MDAYCPDFTVVKLVKEKQKQNQTKDRCGEHAHTYLVTQCLRCTGQFFLNGAMWCAVLCCRCLSCNSGGWIGGAESWL